MTFALRYLRLALHDRLPAIGLLIAAALTIADVQAGDTSQPPYTLTGPRTQGGLLIGRAAPGSRVSLDGQTVPVAPDGRFVIGFGRQAGPSAGLSVEEPNGAQHQTALTIAARDYDIQKIDGLPSKKVSPDKQALARIKSERAAMLAARRGGGDIPLFTAPAGGPVMLWPLLGRISGVYGSQRILNGKPRSPHLGVDIAAPKGTLIRAPAAGRVSLVHDDMFFTGKTVMLDHGHGVTSVYAHLDQIFAQEGQPVLPGEAIGTVGATGRATGPHLHWGVHWRGIGLDPALLTGPMPAADSADTAARAE